MQRAPHGVADNETVGKGAVVVGTVSAHSEDLIATANQNSVLAINLARYHLPVPQILLREACSEIRLRLLCVLVHVVLQKRLLFAFNSSLYRDASLESLRRTNRLLQR